MTRVKICGLTRAEDAVLAAALGADALGFVLWPKSPRAITPDRVRAIVRQVPAFVSRVGVFVNASPTDVRNAVREAELDVVQLHGDEDVAAYAEVGARLVRGLALEDKASLMRAAALPAHVTPLVDAADPVRRGGTGRVGNWDRAAVLAAERPIILAGGLTADNLADAVRHVRPWAIDVSSGVESAPGVKSAERLRQLFDAVSALRVEGL